MFNLKNTNTCNPNSIKFSNTLSELGLVEFLKLNEVLTLIRQFKNLFASTQRNKK